MRYFMICLLLLFIFSCRKNELNEPTSVAVSIDINRSASSSGHLQFDQGYIRLASFGVEGTRQEGPEVELYKEFENGNLHNFSSSAPVANLNLNIPQGNYTDLDINFNTYDDGDNPTIVVQGIYTNQSSQNIPVLFEFLSSEFFSINSESDDGGSIIELSKEVPSNALIKLDPIYWFDLISTNSWDNAALTEIDGVMTIVINESNNSAIYDVVVDRIDEQTSSTFGN